MAILSYSIAGKSKNIEFSNQLYAGSDSSNQLEIPHSAFAARQFQISFQSPHWMLRNLNPLQPTRVNGVAIKEAFLTFGDTIKVGDWEFQFAEALRVEPPQEMTSLNVAWHSQLKNIALYAETTYPVLITGPSGSGKESIADAIHKGSKNRLGPLIKVNCSALQETLIESELFGHKKGAFTGAIDDRKGAFEAARGGTLFLDEIGDLSLGLQAKLLRALENCEIKAVGSDHTTKVDCRIVAATHQNLRAMVQEGRFRMDLFYRLNVIELTPPALTERMEDFENILFSIAKEHRVCFSQPAIEEMKKYSWPGNIRELKNCVVKASIILRGSRIGSEDLEKLGINTNPDAKLSPAQFAETVGTQSNVLKDIEKDIILTRLVANSGNQRQTALELGVPKSTLNDRLKAYGLNTKALKRRLTASPGLDYKELV